MNLRHIDVLLVLGPPASGKSMIGRYVATNRAELAAVGLDIGPLVPLDDFHYVRSMWRICELMERAGYDSEFLEPNGLLFRDPREWSTLIHLLNEDYTALQSQATKPQASTLAAPTESPGEWLVSRLERAHVRAGLEPPFGRQGPAVRATVVAGLQDEAANVATECAMRRLSPGSTVLLEFSRGGPDGASLPLPSPYGYAHALALLSPAILSHAVILHVHVTPEESRRRNRQRAEPSANGTIEHHAVPEPVMRAYYGTDDMPWLIANAERLGSVTIRSHGQVFHVPLVPFDNEVQRAVASSVDRAAWEQTLSKVFADLAAATRPEPPHHR